jgi:hypothetical protein
VSLVEFWRVDSLKRGFDSWFGDVGGDEMFDFARLFLGFSPAFRNHFALHPSVDNEDPFPDFCKMVSGSSEINTGFSYSYPFIVLFF